MKPRQGAAALPREVRIIGGQWKRSKLPVADKPGLRPTPERVRETLEWADWKIPEALWADLSALPFATDDPEATRQYSAG